MAVSAKLMVEVNVMEVNVMSRRQKSPLRPLTAEERRHLEQIGRACAAPASHVARAKALLAVAEGHSYTDAARAGGRRSGDAVATLVARFNEKGVGALVADHGGGRRPCYTARERQRILAEARRVADREQDGTAVWSLTTLQRALRKSGLPQVSTSTIRSVLMDAGLTWQRHRSWCDTGSARRRRKRHAQTVVVSVTDLDAEAKKS